MGTFHISFDRRRVENEGLVCFYPRSSNRNILFAKKKKKNVITSLRGSRHSRFKREKSSLHLMIKFMHEFFFTSIRCYRKVRSSRNQIEKGKSLVGQIWRCVTVVKTWRMSLGRYNTEREKKSVCVCVCVYFHGR